MRRTLAVAFGHARSSDCILRFSQWRTPQRPWRSEGERASAHAVEQILAENVPDRSD